MMRVELHALQGGADSELFAHELAEAVSKHSGQPLEAAGKTPVFSRL